MIGKIEKWLRCAVFLSLKNQWSARHEKQQSGDRLIAARACLFMKPQAIGRVRDLVVILKVIHERRGFQIKGGVAALLALPDRLLALIKKTPFSRRDEFLRASAVIS